MLMGIVVQFLLELEERLCKEHPAARVAIEHLLCSLFKSNACIAHLRRVGDRNDWKDKNGVSRDLLNAILKENTHFEEVNYLRDQIHYEKGSLPGLKKILRHVEDATSRWKKVPGSYNRTFNLLELEMECSCSNGSIRSFGLSRHAPDYLH